MPPINAGDTAWVLASSALVLLMTPGLALFYGGMVRTKSVLNMMMMSFATIGLVSVLWVAYGYSIAFTSDKFGGLFGGLDALGLRGILDGTTGPDGDKIPLLAFAAFQLMFAIITPALISGAIADRAKFSAWLVFVGLWVTVVYFPVAHWVFAPDGWILAKLKAFDFAGGTAVHVNAGAAGLALALVLGKRVGFAKKSTSRPHNIPMVLLGAGLLWFGWFGFNAGSALAANGLSAMAFMNTQVATGAALLGWIIVEWLRDGKPTTLGGASGAVAGLVAITPACSTVEPIGAIAIGLIAGVVCALAVKLKYKLGFDDSLDVVGVHLVGGAVGASLIGLFATTLSGGTGEVRGLLYGGGAAQLGKQLIAVGAVGAYSFGVTWLLGMLIEKTMGFRIPEAAEIAGIDESEHDETAYAVTGTFDVAELDEEREPAAVAAAPAPAPTEVPTEAPAEEEKEPVSV